MTELNADMFAQFMEEVHGFRPFRWQERLMSSVLAGGRWPEVIGAPTGAGKSNVIDVHVFANALAACGAGPRVPRRLAIVVNRRAIVDSHQDHAEKIAALLAADDRGPVTALVADALARLTTSRSPHEDQQSPLVVTAVRGALAMDTGWLDDPSACAVIAATPDMWGSRVLFQGYGASRFARPRHAGLLAVDSVMVLDEAHLNRQLLMSARRIAELQRTPLPLPGLQVVATTATPDQASDVTTVGIVESDLIYDAPLAARLQKPKPVELVPCSHWPGARRPSKQYAERIAELATAKVAEASDRTVGCVVNSVFTAREVAKILARELGDEAVLLWVGPMRPLDLERARESYPGAFTADGDPRVRVVVATQTLEVGIDVDFAALVTELAPGSALAQRAGRLNRLGRRDDAPCVVLIPEHAPTAGTGPYDGEEIAAAYEWIHRISDAPAGIAPVTQLSEPAPEATRRRAVFSRIERGDVDQLAFDSERQVGEHDLRFWIRDDFDDDDRASLDIVLRGPLPIDEIATSTLLAATPPIDRETYPVSIKAVHEVIDKVVRNTTGHTRRAFVWRDGTVDHLDLDGADRVDLRPGDQLILDSTHPVAHQGVMDVDDGSVPAETLWGDALLVLSSAVDADNALLTEVTRSVRQALDDIERRARYEDVPQGAREAAIDSTMRECLVDEIAGLGDTAVQLLIPMIPADEDQAIPWLVVRTDTGVTADDEIRQRWAGGGEPVALDVHQIAVGNRAAELAASVGLGESIGELLRSAGRWHDEGKAHRGFQTILGNLDGRGEPLAKSGGADSGASGRRRKRSVLPRGWRHEQLSVVLAERELGQLDRGDRELILRLVGTSHGRGRADFAHAASDVLAGAGKDVEQSAVLLFDEGGWEELIDATSRTWGQWGCAYLEAVLRAADCTVSKEGS